MKAEVNWYWPLAIVIIGALLFAYCTYSTDKATESLDRSFNVFDNQACYQAGYNAAVAGRNEAPTSSDSEECARWLERGFADGERLHFSYDDLFSE